MLERLYPEAHAAFLAGSVVRGGATATSDLDIVIIGAVGAYRESLEWDGWPVELFVHTETSLHTFFESDLKRRRPSLPTMCAEGIILKDTEGIATRAKAEAQALLAEGAPPLTVAERVAHRYFVTDVLEDFIGTQDAKEALFIAGDLAVLLADFVLDEARQWRGKGKWLLRALRRYDPVFAARYAEAFESFYRSGDKEGLVGFVDGVLEPLGGRLFAGYSVGKP